MRIIKILYACIFLILLSQPVQAQQLPESSTPRLVVNLPSRTIELYIENKPIKKYPVAIGKPSTPTPLGHYSAITKEIDPVWYPPNENYHVPSGPGNPLGYRWIGIGGNYGIHGTNAPWSIGYAVSNGCIRMFEEDVEELFEIVPHGTPVVITYDRVQIQINKNNQLCIQVFPDVYGYKKVNVEEIKQKLAAYQVDDLISENKITEIVARQSENPIVLAEYFDITINNTTLTDRGIKIDGKLLLPIKAIAECLNLPLSLDKQKKQVCIQKTVLPARIKTDNAYVALDDFKMLGGAHVFNRHKKKLESIIPVLYVNGQPISTNISIHGEKVFIPVNPLLESLENQANWNIVQKQIIKPSPIPSSLMMSLDGIVTRYRAHAFYDKKRHRIDITYLAKNYRAND